MTDEEMVRRWLAGAKQAEIGEASGLSQVQVSYRMRKYLFERYGRRAELNGKLQRKAVRPLVAPTLRERLGKLVAR